MSADESYDLKKSKKRIGQLYPVLTDKKGNIIDGNHRLEADPNWRKQVVPEIETEEDLLIARCVSNWHRRRITAEEKIKWINDLAELYKKQGYKVLITGNEIVKKIVEATGVSTPTVYKYLDDKYKVYSQKNRKRTPSIPASERIANKLGTDVLERHEKEVEERIRKELMEDQEVITTSSRKRAKKPKTQLDKPAQPDFSNLFVTKSQNVFDLVSKPLERFLRIDLSELNELDSEQKEELLATLLKTEKKLSDWISTIRD